MTVTGHRSRTLNLIIALYFAFASTAGVLAQHETHTQDTAALLEQGQALAAAGRLAESERPLAEAAALTPNDVPTLTLLAEVKSRLGEGKEAVILFRRVVAARPRSATSHLNLAIALADTGDRVAALREVDEAIQLDPNNARAYLNRARMQADGGHAAAAGADFERAAELKPKDPEIEFFWGVFSQDNHRPQVSARLFADVVAQQPDNGRAYLLLGQSLEAIGRDESAIAALRRAVALVPSSREAAYALFQALRKRNDPDAARALEQFNRLVSESEQTNRARELGNEAYAAIQKQSWSAAKDALERAIAICGSCPIEADLHQRLGLSECHGGDITEGEKELRIALSLKPDDLETVEALQWVADQRSQLKTK